MIRLQDIHNAADRIADTIDKTPILTSKTLSQKSGSQLFLKGEHMQKTGAFKIRGATNRIISEAHGGTQHVVTASSGNHGQAVAYIAGKRGLNATIVVPEDAMSSKVAAIRGYGAEVVTCGTTSNERLQKAEQLTEQKQAVFVPPYDDPLIMAGQGTVGLEMLEQVPDLDAIYVPVGGGGLISGIATAIKETNPAIKVIGVEPQMANDTLLSKQTGRITAIDEAKTIADGLRTLQPGTLTFPVVQHYVDDIVLVGEDEIKETLLFVLERTKHLIEPSGAVSVAAALANKGHVAGGRVCSVISGGNIAMDQLVDLVKEKRP